MKNILITGTTGFVGSYLLKNFYLKKKIYIILRGKSKKTILISSYLCHPAMANNELSGPLVLIGLYNKIKKWKYKP